jgi:Rrf2 family protein
MLTKKTEYAIRAMWEIAHHDGSSLTTATAIAKRQEIPPKYLPQIVSELSRAALVVTARGFGGGLRLNRPPNQITLLEIIEATQGKMTMYECQACVYECQQLPNCQLQKVYDKAQRSLEDTFRDVSLADLKFSAGVEKR